MTYHCNESAIANSDLLVCYVQSNVGSGHDPTGRSRGVFALVCGEIVAIAAGRGMPYKGAYLNDKSEFVTAVAFVYK